MSDGDWKSILIAKGFAYPALIPIALGLAALFLATAGWPPKIEPTAGGTRIVLFTVAGLSLLSGAVLLAKLNRRKDATETKGQPDSVMGREFVGVYRAENEPNYENVVSSLGGECFKIFNRAWDGVGVFDGKNYHGIYKYNDQDQKRRGLWGVHKAGLVCEEGQWRLRGQGWEWNEVSGFVLWEKDFEWFRQNASR